VALLLAGCSSAPDYTPHGKVTVKVDEEKKRTRGTAHLANLVTIELPAPEPAGYVWQISAHDTRFLKQRTELAPVGAAAGPWAVAFFALRTGTTRIRFLLVPPTGERGKEPVDIEDVVLAIE